MENKNYMESAQWKDGGSSRKKKTKITPRTVILMVSCAIFLVAVIYTIGVVLLHGRSQPPVQEEQESYDFDSRFQGCTLLFENCLDQSCDKYLYCNDKAYKTCRVYDCRDSFGIGTQDSEDKIDIRKIMKPDTEKIVKTVAQCQGSLDVLENKCVDKKMQLKVKVGTAGNCSVSNFTVFYKELGFRSSRFSALGDNQYLITSDYCNPLERILAIGTGGTTIKEKQF